jgi:hypothetical protein
VCQAFANLDSGIAIDVTGTTSDGAASTTVSQGGAGVTTTQNNSLVINMSTRTDDVANTWSASGFTNVTGGAGSGASLLTTSGADFAAQWAYAIKAAAGAVSQANFSISGGTITSQASTGGMIALKAAPFADIPDVNQGTYIPAEAWGLERWGAERWLGAGR